jgi:hypothetical protein
MQVFIGRNPKSTIRWIRKVSRCVKIHVSGGGASMFIGGVRRFDEIIVD